MIDRSPDGMRPGASAAFFIPQIGKFPRPCFSSHEGTGTGAASASVFGTDQRDAAAAGEEPGFEPSDSGSLTGNASPGGGDNEGESVAKDQQSGGDNEGAGSEPDPLDAVPEDGRYDFSLLDLPDGMEIDSALADMAGPRMAEANLSQKQANEVAKIFTDLRKQQLEEWQKTNLDWQASVKADKELGGDNLQGALVASETFIDEFGTRALRDYLVSSGGGNHPEIIRAFARAGKALAEDNPGGKASTGTPDTASILYPND